MEDGRESQTDAAEIIRIERLAKDSCPICNLGYLRWWSPKHSFYVHMMARIVPGWNKNKTVVYQCMASAVLPSADWRFCQNVKKPESPAA